MLKLSASKVQESGITLAVQVFQGDHYSGTLNPRKEDEDELIALLNAATELLEMCKNTRCLYDHLLVGPLQVVCKHGNEHEEPTVEDLLQLRETLECLIAKAEGGAG